MLLDTGKYSKMSQLSQLEELDYEVPPLEDITGDVSRLQINSGKKAQAPVIQKSESVIDSTFCYSISLHIFYTVPAWAQLLLKPSTLRPTFILKELHLWPAMPNFN